MQEKTHNLFNNWRKRAVGKSFKSSICFIYNKQKQEATWLQYRSVFTKRKYLGSERLFHFCVEKVMIHSGSKLKTKI